MADTSAYYRLARIDGVPLPVPLEYADGECLITDGDLVLRRDNGFGGDGMICVRLFGSIYGLPRVDQIFLEREAFDRLDAEHLTYPGGWRHRQGIPPHSVIRYTHDGVEVTTLASEAARRGGNHTFGPHRWSFSASHDQIVGSDLTGG